MRRRCACFLGLPPVLMVLALHRCGWRRLQLLILLLLKVMVLVVVVMVARSLPVPSRIIDPEQCLVDSDTAHLSQLGRVTQAQHRPQICLRCHKPVPGAKVQVVLLRVEEGLPGLPGYAKRSPVLSEGFTAGFMANVKVRWNLGL